MKNKRLTMKTVINEKETFPIDTSVEMLKTKAQEKQRKFVESVDIAINLNIDPKQSNQNIRCSVPLPAGNGKDVKVVVFTDDTALAGEALKAGAVKAGLNEVIADIENGFLDFDYCIATPSVMKNLSKIAKKLGPRGLMPNPKLGNITDDVITVLNQAKKGKVNLKNDKAGIIHACVGKINFANEDLISNIKAVINTIKEAKPEAVKGKFVKSIYLSTTMGPSVAIKLENLL